MFITNRHTNKDFVNGRGCAETFLWGGFRRPVTSRGYQGKEELSQKNCIPFLSIRAQFIPGWDLFHIIVYFIVDMSFILGVYS